jgi:iron complex outermembrane recepter protein
VPTASDPISLVAGANYGKDEYEVAPTSTWPQATSPAWAARARRSTAIFDVTEVYFEAGIPLYQGGEVFQSVSTDIGYRYSDYSNSGGVNSYKIGLSAQVTDYVRLRGGFNRAIRAPGVERAVR